LTQSLFILGQLFSQPLDIPTSALSFLWTLPICLSIALVYKALKLETIELRMFVREVALLFSTIVGFLILVAIVLLGIAHLAGQL